MKNENKPALLALLVICIISSLSSGIFHLNKNIFLYGITLNIATTFLAALIIFIVFFYTGGDPVIVRIDNLKNELKNILEWCSTADQIAKSCHACGIYEIIPERKDRSANMWEYFIDSNSNDQKEVDILGKVTRRVAETIKAESIEAEKEREVLIEKIQNGLKLRILMLDPTCESARKRMKEEEDDDSSTVGKMHKFDKILHNGIEKIIYELKEKMTDNMGEFFFGYYDTTPHCQITRVDDEMLITNYIHKYSGRHCFSMKVNKKPNGEIFEKYKKSYEKILEDIGIDNFWYSKTDTVFNPRELGT